ncbi:hypothetical protein [Chamaesiphon sp. VAR_48_metabat_135_sub]|uniref:hypothetical protein n=1 Tax=Chamaesiphon sp. VAR_48_metabat_135_sub TaxID=2964699 RepID=UPI00286B8CA4|nr:hypothetical protein [Chamaesiphon sp. VAR_48_metabat_135_sub]
MSPIAEEIYTSVIQTLSPTDRLQLATLILDGLKQNVSVIDISDHWTEQDRSDVTNFSLQYAASLFSEEENVEDLLKLNTRSKCDWVCSINRFRSSISIFQINKLAET